MTKRILVCGIFGLNHLLDREAAVGFMGSNLSPYYYYEAKKPAVYGDAALHRVASTVIIPLQGNNILLLHGIFTTPYITRQTKEPSPV